MFIIAQPRPLPQANAYGRFIAGHRVPASASVVRVSPAVRVAR